ncbi:MAG: SIR2 family protein [Verrucomicrobiota bacterium]|jgi:hypothetical protein
MIEIPEPLMTDISDGRCLPFIGAGFSLNAKLPPELKMPDWNGLAKQLAQAAKLDASLSPPMIAERYEQRFGRVQLIEAIRKALHAEKAKPGSAHLSFAMLPFDTVYTTNFDLLLEEAYSARGRPFRSLVGELQMPFHAGRMAPNIVKLHGDLRHEEHIIVTQKDYDTFLQRYPVIATHLSAMLITLTPFFIGYSLSDPDFLHIRNVIRARLGDFERMAYVVQFDATEEDVEKALSDRIHLISLSTGANRTRDDTLAELFESVQKRMDTDAGTRFRASRPDAFEPLEGHIIARAVGSSEASAVLAATSTLCFVLMPFSEKFDVAYRKLIAPVAAEAGLTVARADELSAPGSIIERIRVAIQQARVCIVDLTETNANVMFELGLAQAAGKPTVLLSQDLSRLPFGVRSQRIIKYDGSNPQAAQPRLRAALKAVLSSERLMEAKQLIGSGHYRAAILEAIIFLEVGLRELAARSGDERLRLAKAKPMGEVVRKLEEAKILSVDERKILIEVMRIRNQAVHLHDEPTQGDASKVIVAAEQFSARFDKRS